VTLRNGCNTDHPDDRGYNDTVMGTPREHLPPTPVTTVRVERGLTQLELAEAAGISRPLLATIEARHYVPLTNIRKRIAEALDSTEEDLWPQLFAESYARSR
jgi:DNA-binding XRE family transcriptional regulator